MDADTSEATGPGFVTPTAPAFALGKHRHTTPYLMATEHGARLLDEHSPELSAPLMGGNPHTTVAFYFMDVSFITDVVRAALLYWHGCPDARSLPMAEVLSRGWTVVALRNGMGLIECRLDDPIHGRQTATTRMGDWFDGPLRPDTPSTWKDARPAFLFTVDGAQDSAHTRLYAARTRQEDRLLLERRMGHGGSFTWTADGHLQI